MSSCLRRHASRRMWKRSSRDIRTTPIAVSYGRPPPVIEEASGLIVYLLMSYGKAEEVSGFAATLAREHGLVCFDPQGECLRP